MSPEDFQDTVVFACLPLNGPAISYVINPLMAAARCDVCLWGAQGGERRREKEREAGRQGGRGSLCEEGRPGARPGGQHGPALTGCTPRRGAVILFLKGKMSAPPQPSLQGKGQEPALGAPLASPPPVCRSSGKSPLLQNAEAAGQGSSDQ